MHYTSRIHADPAVMRGKPVIKGTRLAVEFIVGLLADGWTNEQISSNYNIAKEDIEACLRYAVFVLEGDGLMQRAAG